MNKEFGCQDMTKTIKRILIKHPNSAYKTQANIDEQAKNLNYFGIPNFEQAINDYNKFLNILKSFDIEIHTLPADNKTSLDSIYTHDPCLISNSGVILCSMGKQLRKSEPEMIANYFSSIGIPIAGEITPPGNLEGGDIVWIDDRTVAVGVGYRSNLEGINQLKSILGSDVDTIIPVDLPPVSYTHLTLPTKA